MSIRLINYILINQIIRVKVVFIHKTLMLAKPQTLFGVKNTFNFKQGLGFITYIINKCAYTISLRKGLINKLKLLYFKKNVYSYTKWGCATPTPTLTTVFKLNLNPKDSLIYGLRLCNLLLLTKLQDLRPYIRESLGFRFSLNTVKGFKVENETKVTRRNLVGFKCFFNIKFLSTLLKKGSVTLLFTLSNSFKLKQSLTFQKKKTRLTSHCNLKYIVYVKEVKTKVTLSLKKSVTVLNGGLGVFNATELALIKLPVNPWPTLKSKYSYIINVGGYRNCTAITNNLSVLNSFFFEKRFKVKLLKMYTDFLFKAKRGFLGLTVRYKKITGLGSFYSKKRNLKGLGLKVQLLPLKNLIIGVNLVLKKPKAKLVPYIIYNSKKKY